MENHFPKNIEMGIFGFERFHIGFTTAFWNFLTKLTGGNNVSGTLGGTQKPTYAKNFVDPPPQDSISITMFKYLCPARGYCVERSKKSCSCVHPSIRE